MISRGFPLALFVIVFVPGLLRAQANENPILYRSSVADSTNNDKMYEDIEILRRILDRQLHDLYPSHTYTTFGMVGMQGGQMGMQGGQMGMHGGMMGMRGGMGDMQSGMGIAGGMMPVTMPIPSLEGVYLRGQGVLYTATLASLQRPVKTAKAETAKPVSEWESVRRQLRHEKEEPKKPEASKPLTLSDGLLKVLSENGHHFSQLGENESLTIVLTVHEANPPSSPQKSAGGGGSGGGMAKTGSKSANDGGSDLRGKIGDLELLGDLHQKQGHYEEAITAFQKAVELKPSPKEAAGLYRKLAQCYLALEKNEEARSVLNQYTEFLIHAQLVRNARNTSAAAKPSAPALPIKLIISAPKKLLGELKAGRISFDDFRHQAHIETLRFDERR